MTIVFHGATQATCGKISMWRMKLKYDDGEEFPGVSHGQDLIDYHVFSSIIIHQPILTRYSTWLSNEGRENGEDWKDSLEPERLQAFVANVVSRRQQLPRTIHMGWRVLT